MWKTERLRALSVPRSDFTKVHTQRRAVECVSLRAVESPLRRRRARSKGRVGPLTRSFFLLSLFYARRRDGAAFVARWDRGCARRDFDRDRVADKGAPASEISSHPMPAAISAKAIGLPRTCF